MAHLFLFCHTTRLALSFHNIGGGSDLPKSRLFHLRRKDDKSSLTRFSANWASFFGCISDSYLFLKINFFHFWAKNHISRVKLFEICLISSTKPSFCAVLSMRKIWCRLSFAWCQGCGRLLPIYVLPCLVKD